MAGKRHKGRSNFDRKSYKDNDQRGKDALKPFFKGKGFSVSENPDNGENVSYKCPDVIIEKGLKTFYIEAQINTTWDSTKTPDGRPQGDGFYVWNRKINQICYPYMHGEDADMRWFTVSNDETFAVVCPPDAKEIGRKILPNPRYGKEANVDPFEVVHVMDLTDCKFVNLETGDIEPFRGKEI